MSVRESLAVRLVNAGESPMSIAQSFGVSKWAIYKRIQRARNKCAQAVRDFSAGRVNQMSLSNFAI